MQTPPPSLLISVLWMMFMDGVVYSTGKIMKKFSDLYFSSYGHFCFKNCQFSMNFSR